MRIGILTNRASRHNRNGWRDAIAHIENEPDVLHLLREDGTSSRELLQRFAAEEVDLLVVNGGDGTVQRVLTALLEDRPFARPPALALLPRGTANMTAAELGIGGRGPRALARLLELVRSGGLESRLVEREVLRVTAEGSPAAQRGFFFGALAICDAIRHCTRKFHRRGLVGELSHALTLVSLLLRAALAGPQRAGLHCGDIEITLDGRSWGRGPRLLLFASTLARLVLRSRPFWNRQRRPIGATAVHCAAPRLLLHAPRVLYGGDVRELPAGYESGGGERLVVRGLSEFVLDGEFFSLSRNREITITADERLRFVRL